MRFCRLLVFAACVLVRGQLVTDTRVVDSGKGQELLRKINGRWWSQDNREVYPPSHGGVFWELDSKPGICEFYHHRPFQLQRAEALHLWMKPEEVEVALGKPNRIFPMGPGGARWYYYAANGTKLDIWLMEGELGDAEFSTTGKRWMAASIERELNGRSIFKLKAERAGKRSEEQLARWSEQNRADQAARSAALRHSGRHAASGPDAPVEQAAGPEHPSTKRIISAEALASITPGMNREEVVSRLGEPGFRTSISTEDGQRETFTYHLEDGQAIAIRLLDGKVRK